MPLFDITNIIGSSVYFVLAVLLAWMSRIPRTNPGACYWAIAIFFACCGRVTLFVMPPLLYNTLTENIYSLCILMEKTFLLLGALTFLNKSNYLRPYLMLVAAGLVWVVSYWVFHFNPLVFALGFSLFNSCALVAFGVIAYREREALPHGIMLFTACICFLFALHWLSYSVLRLIPFWLVPGFLLGTSLSMLLYLSLTSAVLLQFQNRLIDAEKNALDMAYHDPLTGLHNKRYMTSLFDQILLLATRPHQMLAVIYIDLDNFKPINDSAGHAIGDEVLKTIAKRLMDNTRSTDICARIGGDEFVVIATQLESVEQAHHITEKILHQCCQPIEIDKKCYQLGASIGVSIYPNHGNDLGQLLKAADRAMYDVKKNGKSDYQVFR